MVEKLAAPTPPSNRLQATVGGLGVDMPARRAFAHRGLARRSAVKDGEPGVAEERESETLPRVR